MFYRLRQFIIALFPKINSSDLNWTLKYLSSEASELFLRQSPIEQRHAIDVAKNILASGNLLSPSDLETLVTAALLHDCGKSLVNIRLWHRIIIVIMQKMPSNLQVHFERRCSILALPLKMASQHALWGEALAKRAGINSKVCLLIREHHSPKTDLGKLLAQADNTN